MERLLYVDPELKNIYNFNENKWNTTLEYPRKIFRTSKISSKFKPSAIYILFREKSYFYITIWDEDYPQLLREIQDPPFVLYGKGEKDFLNKVNKLAVVGTREPSLYGYESLKFILHPLLEREWLIVSGFAKGIDTMSHEITVRHHCPTIAILGHGLSFMYPKENRLLYEMWKEYILLLTEYPPHYAPKNGIFQKEPDY